MNNLPEEKPLVSIVLCTYNGEAFLLQQIETLLHQTYAPIEIIISDDASTDGTPQLLKSFAQNPLFRIYFQPQNKGYIHNFAFALAQAKGQYIALCDQDDIWLPHKIETLVRCIGDCLLTYSNSLLVDENGNSLNKKLSSIRNMEAGKDTHSFFMFNVAWGHAILLNRKLLDAAIPIPEGIPHDIWLAYKAATITGISYCNEVLTHYRQHSAAYTQTLMPKQVPTRTKTERHLNYLKQLYWLQVMKEHAQPGEQDFYAILYRLFKEKEKGAYNYALFMFLWKHQLSLYRFSKKNFLSRLIDIRKLARGERGK